MNSKIFLLCFGFIAYSVGSVAQNKPYNPYESIGKEAKVLTLSNGLYNEFFDIDTIEIIGSAILNTKTMKVIGFVKQDTLYSEATLEPEVISRWLSPDPFARKYPDLSPYIFVGNNPIINIEVDGRYFVGVNGVKVNVTLSEGKIQLGENASQDLRTIAARINKFGSATATGQFVKAANNPTKIHFKILKEKIDNGLLGLHQAHDEEGNALEWVGDGTTGKFSNMPAYISDEQGNIYYKEASITIFEGNISEDELGWVRLLYGDPNITKEESTVSTFGHEVDHDINQEAIKAIKERQQGGTNTFDVEGPAEGIESKTFREIKENRKDD